MTLQKWLRRAKEATNTDSVHADLAELCKARAKVRLLEQ